MRYIFLIIFFNINLLSMQRLVIYENYDPIFKIHKPPQQDKPYSFNSDLNTLKNIVYFNKLKLNKELPIRLSYGDKIAFKRNRNFNNLPSTIKLFIFSLIQVKSLAEMLKQISSLFRTNFELMNIINGNYRYLINIMVSNYVQKMSYEEKNKMLGQWINLMPKLKDRHRIAKAIKYVLKLASIDINKEADLLIAIKKANDEKTPRSYNTVKLLLDDKQVNINAQDAIGNTSLIWATYYQNLTLVELLLNYQADPNIKNEAGDSALIIALDKGNSDIVKLLLNSKADITIKNANGTSAIQLAKNILLKE